MTQEKRQQALQNQIRRLEAQLAHGQQVGSQITRVRLVLFVLAALVSGFTFLTWGAAPWLVVSIFAFAPFVVMVVLHRRVDTAVTRTHIYLQIKRAHQARMNLDWAHLPPPLPVPERQEHPFAFDVDLLGPRSLHHLLDTAVSHEGAVYLRDWLLNTQPDPQTIARRQALVGELTTWPRFRDRLALEATLVVQSGHFSGRAMLDWLNKANDPARLRPLLLGLSLLAAANIILFLLDVAGILPNLWLVTWAIYGVLYVTVGMRGTGSLFRDVLTLQDGLETVQAVFGFLETVRYGRATHVQTLCTPFLNERERPSLTIRRTRKVAAGVGLQQNPFVGFLLNAVLPWNLFFAYQMARCQVDLKERLPVWLHVWYELEALNSLAMLSWLNPDTTSFPQIETAQECLFAARQLGHPLVPTAVRVTNDYEVGEVGTITIITGSNMAGKSTFLRTLGVNLALAYAGGPVVAGSLHTSQFRLFASIRVADSLTDGFSFFYAEVRRLEQLLSELGYASTSGSETSGRVEREGSAESEASRRLSRPLFFLIDEIFRGTNNRERLIGSRAYIRALAAGRGTGLIATHDLELIHLAEENEKIHNAHFRDDVVDGRMVFDYKLHPGPCPTTNALKIMRLAGLPVEEM